MKLTATQLRQAGFDEETILSLIEDQRPILKQAGFSDVEINKEFGIAPTHSNSLLNEDMQEPAYENQKLLGSKDEIEKKTDNELSHTNTQNNIKNNKTAHSKTFDMLKEVDQQNIVQKIDEAYKLFKDDGEGRVGFINDWMENSYPNLTYDAKQFYTNRDLTVAESAVNDTQVKDSYLDNETKRLILEGKIGFDAETNRYITNKEHLDQVAEELKNKDIQDFIKENTDKDVKYLHTQFTTGKHTNNMLEHVKQYFGVDDIAAQNFNEAVSAYSWLESDNRNIIGYDGNAAGLFQIRKNTLPVAVQRYINIMTRNDPTYQVPVELELALEHKDVTALDPDLQRALTMAYLLETPASEKFNRIGTDDIIKAGLNGDVNAWKTLYREYHHASYEKLEDGTYKLRDLPALDARIEKAFDVWGKLYEYETPQMGFFSSDSTVAKAIRKLPYGGKFITAFGGESRYNVFSNGYALSVNGLIDRYHQLITEDKIPPKEALQKVFMYQEQTFSKEVIQSAVTLVNDLPWMAAGCFAAAGATIATTGPMGGIAAPVVCGAGGFAIPEALRDSYMRAIDSGEVNDFNEFLEHFMDVKTAITAGKGAVIGGATFGAGAKVKQLTGSTAARLGTEVVTMTTLGAALEGHVPTARDFAHATVLIFGIHGSIAGLRHIKNMYRKYSVHPKDIVRLAEENGEFRKQIMNIEEPSIFQNGSKTVLQGLEKETNIKLLPPPKFKNNEVVNISVEGTQQGKVVGKEVFGNDNVLIIQKANGEKIPVLETEARKIDPIPVEAKVNGDKIEIANKQDNTFKSKQENGVFSKEIVELTKDKDGAFVVDNRGTYKSTPLQAVLDTGKRVLIETTDGKVSTNKNLLVKNEFYPKISKILKDSRIKEMEGKFKTSNELISRVFKGLSTKHKKVTVVFAADKGGKSYGKDVDVMVGRIGKEYVEFSRKAYNELIKFTDKDGKIKKAEMVGNTADAPLAFIHPETRNLIALLMPRRIDNGLKAQADRYFKDHKIKEDMDGMHFDRVNNSRSGDNWGIPNEPYGETKINVGENNAPWKRFYNSPRGLDLIDLVEMYKVFVQKSPEINKLPEGLNGYFQFKGKQSPRIVINEALQKKPEQFTMTMAHELGHLIDYLPDASLKRGNILGSIASLKGYMNKWIAGKNDGAKPLDPKEIAKMKVEAEKIAKRNEKNTNKEIQEDLKVTPETILQIFKDPNAREKIDPAFYNAFIKLSGPLKKEVVKDAMKGMMNHHMKAIADQINGRKVDPKLSEEANRIFKEMFEKELKDRGLVNVEMITKELKNVSAKWKPFDRAASPKYTKYRDGPRELMADFMMAWLLKPNWVKKEAPKTYEMWHYYMDAKPEVAKIWEQLQTDLVAGSNVRNANVYTSILNMFKNTEAKMRERIEKDYSPSRYDQLSYEMIDHMTFITRRLGGVSGENRAGYSLHTKDLQYYLENYRYRHALLKQYKDALEKEVIKPAKDMGYTHHDIGVTLLLRNLAESNQRKDTVTALGLRKFDPSLAEKLGTRSAEQLFKDWATMHPDLVRFTDNFYEVRNRMVIPVLKESKVYDAELMSKIENNREYITYNVKDYILNRMEKFGQNNVVTSAIKGTRGSLKDIQNPLLATMEKDMILMTEAKRHKLMALTVKWLKDNKSWLEQYDFTVRGKAKKRDISKVGKERIIEKPKYVGPNRLSTPEKGLSPFHYMQEGKLKTYYVNSFVARGFSANPLTQWYSLRLVSAAADVFRKAFTEYNPAFWPINLARDVNRAVKMLPNARYIDPLQLGKRSYIKYLFKAIKPAYKSIFRDGTELTRWMEKEGFLISMVEGYRGQAGSKALRKGIDNDTFMLEKLLDKEVKKHGTLGKLYDRTFGELFNKLGNFARMFERTPKIAGTMFLKDQIARGKIKMTDKDMMLFIQTYVGSPNFLRQGGFHAITNNLILYSNAFKEGWRGDYARFKEAPTSVGSKFIAYNVMPKVLQKGIELGLFGTALGVAAKYGIDEWDRTNYIPVILGQTKDGRVVYFRIPQDESSRIINGVLYKIMETATGEDDTILNTPLDLMGYVGSSGVPSPNPIINLLGDFIGWMNGTTPWDDWRGTTAIDKDLDKSTLFKKQVEIVKWFFNTYSGQGFYKFRSDDLGEIQGELENILELPIIGRPISRFLKIGNDPLVGYMRDGPDGVEEYDKQQANQKVLLKMAIKNMVNKPQGLDEKQIEMLGADLSWLDNKLVLDQLGRRAGVNESILDIITEKDNTRKFLMIRKLVMGLKELQDEYPIEKKKE